MATDISPVLHGHAAFLTAAAPGSSWCGIEAACDMSYFLKFCKRVLQTPPKVSVLNDLQHTGSQEARVGSPELVS